MAKIVVVGSISTDFVVETKNQPAQGETVFGEDFSTSFGGKGANPAVACAKLGTKTSMIGAQGGIPTLEQMKESEYYEEAWHIK